MKPYPAYKDSGVAWLGAVPEGWKITRIKHLASEGYKTFTDGDWIESPYITNDGVRLIQTGNIGIGEYTEQGFRFITEETLNKLRCTEIFPNDILICRLAAPVGRACLAPELENRMITSVDVCILKPKKEVNAKYVVYFLSSDKYLFWVDSLARGSTRSRISRSMLGDFEIPLPPLPEQTAIAAYLDRKTAQIDSLIEQKRRLISLLQEERTALISQAVTKGLNPAAPMQDSGIEWIGAVPAGWEVVKLKWVATLEYGNSLSAQERQDGDVPVYGSNGVVGTHNQAITQAPCIIVGRKGSFGKVNFSETPCFPIDTTFFIDSTTTSHNLYWLFYLLPLLGLDEFSRDSAVPGLNREDAYANMIPLSPPAEQTAIAAHLDEKTAQIDQTIARTEQQIELLQEYRTTLISAVVTGKVDVREEVAGITKLAL